MAGFPRVHNGLAVIHLLVSAMSAGEASEGPGGGVIGVLLAPLRLPGRALQTLGSLATAARDVATIRSELTRVREQTEPLVASDPMGVRPV